ncbi:extracellular solute-binding protein [Virgibacillus sp. W0430]|uniref:extracellular solute-binding protein n=1 Tax=Virgibacillus sp. W0430 TaxID=3391580 RepID=UPI003F479096
MAKKFLVLFLTLMLLTITACNSSTNSENENDNEGKKKLNILMESLPDTEFVVEIADQFTEETGIELNFEVITYETMHEKLIPQLTGTSSDYDVIVVDNYWVGEFTSAGWLEPLDEYINKDDFDTSVYLDSMFNMVGQVDGTTYMLPFYNYAMALVYRADVYEDPELKSKYKEEYGRDLEVPESIEEYLNISKFITRETNGEIYGSAMQGLRPDPITMEWLNYLFSSGGNFFDESGKAIINNEAGVEALELYIDSMTNAAPPGANGFGFDEAFNVFAQGNAASFVSYNFMLPKLNNPDESQVAGNVDISHTPFGKSLNGGWGWGIPHNAEDKNASWQFLSWVESQDVAKQRAMLGGSPTRSDVFDDQEVLEKYPHFKEVQEIIATSEMIPIIPEAPQLIEILGRELSIAVSGDKTPQEALDTVAEEIEQLD